MPRDLCARLTVALGDFLPTLKGVAMSTDWLGIEVKRVRVQMSLEFEAFALVASEARTSLTERVAREVVDAVQYHAGHFMDSESFDDGLVCVAEGGETGAVTVRAIAIADSDGPCSSADVTASIQGIEAWK